MLKTGTSKPCDPCVLPTSTCPFKKWNSYSEYGLPAASAGDIPTNQDAASSSATTNDPATRGTSASLIRIPLPQSMGRAGLTTSSFRPKVTECGSEVGASLIPVSASSKDVRELLLHACSQSRRALSPEAIQAGNTMTSYGSQGPLPMRELGRTLLRFVHLGERNESRVDPLSNGVFIDDDPPDV